MLNKITLTNFQSHENLAIDFTAGLNAIRGDNEAGKTTIFNAVGYAYYGARALPLSLEDTVTWGKPVASLKVEHDFTHGGQAYSIVRRKSGAELLGPDGLRVSGHSEVTAYMEKLFNASAAVAVATMIAGQGQLKESLDGSAVSLIETLSNMGLIDQLVDKVQAHLPSGNTRIFETQLADLADLTAPVSDFAPLESTVAAAEVAEYAAVDAAEVALAEYDLAKTEADVAAARLSAASNTDIRRKMLWHQMDKFAETQLATAPVCTEPMSVEYLNAAKAAQAGEAVTAAKWNLFSGLPKAAVNHNRAEVTLEAAEAAEALKAALSTIRTAEIERATARAGIITQSACGLCGKDLTDVPEVVTVNIAAADKVSTLTSLIEVQAVLAKSNESACSAMRSLLAADNAQNAKLGQLVGYVTVDSTVLPSLVTWCGPTVSSEPDKEDYAGRLAVIAKYHVRAQVHAASLAQASVQARAVQAELDAMPVLVSNPFDLLAASDAEGKLRDARAAAALQSAAKQAVASAKFALASAVQAFNFNVERHAAGLSKRSELIATIDAYNANNRLVKKLRDARPVVAKKLWNSVLSAVSTYFSTIRGTASVVTRGDAKFLIDGKSIAAYSGSTKDALGLAIRITLQKTFLGSCDFMLCDEPASAADPVRESAMLGMLASCGYGQVILVTHSDLADSFASNIIRI